MIRDVVGYQNDNIIAGYDNGIIEYYKSSLDKNTVDGLHDKQKSIIDKACDEFLMDEEAANGDPIKNPN